MYGIVISSADNIHWRGGKVMSKLKTTGIYMDPKLKKNLQILCVEKGISMSEYVVKAIEEKMERENEED
jgi:predicted DNA-binding protein